MPLSICSYSFHRLLASGQQDIFRYIRDCKDLGCTQLDPWMAHLAPLHEGSAEWRRTPHPHRSLWYLTSDELQYLAEVRRAAEHANLPFGCIAVDGAHIYDKDPATAHANRAIAYRWIDACAVLGAKQIRIDCGGSETMTDPELAAIRTGYLDVIARAASRNLEVVIENHWGPSKDPHQLLRILAAVPGLGLLWDSYNFHPESRRLGRELCAPHARITHLKTFRFDPAGNEPDEDIPHAIATLKAAGYTGTLGVESCPTDGDEYAAAQKTIALIHRELART